MKLVKILGVMFVLTVAVMTVGVFAPRNSKVASPSAEAAGCSYYTYNPYWGVTCFTSICSGKASVQCSNGYKF